MGKFSSKPSKKSSSRAERLHILFACHSAGWRGVEGPRRCSSAHAVRSFSTTEAQITGPAALRTHGRAYILSCAVIIFHQPVFKVFGPGMIVRNCFFERLCPNVFVTFKLVRAGACS